ncbi:MAG: hypothetical protein IT374_17525 [Polyangiaceae bacterium]|nr:hypothetical protein [Polyangiaceae bacterium]
MINRYRRVARTFEELDLGTLAPLDEALPDLPGAAPPPGGEAQRAPRETSAESQAESQAGALDQRGRGRGPHENTNEFRAVHEAGLEPARLSAPEPKSAKLTTACENTLNSSTFERESAPKVTNAGATLTLSDPVEAALLEALKVATSAVDLDAVKLLAVELRERRLARAGVVDLGSRRDSR